MKTKYFIFAASALVALASCSSDEYVGDNNGLTAEQGDGSIQFTYNLPNATRAGEFIGATAADKLGGMFVVEGTKGSEQSDSPSKDVVFDNYLVGYTANTAGTTESNTHNWEYVGLQAGIDGKLSGATWTSLHSTSGTSAQSIKYWDYSVAQYDFIAWSTGKREAVTTGAVAGSKVNVTPISTGATLAANGFTLTAANATDLLQCYYTDIKTVTKASGNYGKPVTLTFKNLAAKVRIALYETVPGYSVQNVEFYVDETTSLTTNISANEATLYTPDEYKLPQSGTVVVKYPHIGTTHRDAPTADYNKASVTVTPGTSVSATQAFGTLTGTIGTTLPSATFAGAAADNYYTAVIPSTTGRPLTLRVNYTLVSTDGSNETIKIYGAKAVVPATYTVWQPNYAYTYIFKISDNSNGWTDTGKTAQGLIPITFDAMVASFVDANAEQTTITTVATPSITTYQQGHNTGTSGGYTVPDEYNNDGKKLYVKVMDNSATTPAPIATLSSSNSLLFKIEKGSSDYVASEAQVLDVLQNRINAPTGGGGDPEDDRSYLDENPEGRNGISLLPQTNGEGKVIYNGATSIVNGVDNQPISVSAGEVAEINLAGLAGTYAYVYVASAPNAEEKVYHVAAGVTNETSAANYYEVKLTDLAAATTAKAAAGKVYFVANRDAQNNIVSYTFKQTKVNVDDVTGLFEATIPSSKGTASYSADNFYFDVYYQNNGAYAVKVIKVVD